MVACGALLAALAIAVPAAGEGDTRVLIKYRVTSNEPVGEQRFITLVGAGHSQDLGQIAATSSVVVAPIPDGCYPRRAEEVWSTPSGSLDVQSEGQVCGSQISGTWQVTDGDGQLAGASGGGSLSGTLGNGVNVVVSYKGEVSR